MRIEIHMFVLFASEYMQINQVSEVLCHSGLTTNNWIHFHWSSLAHLVSYAKGSQAFLSRNWALPLETMTFDEVRTITDYQKVHYSK